jgi:hypothetical protein
MAKEEEDEEEVVVVVVVVVVREDRSVPSLRERPLRVLVLLLLVGAAGDRGVRRVAVCAVAILL